MRIFALLAYVLLIQACKHPLAIEGEGDIVEQLFGHRGCTLEEFQASSPRCMENDVPDERYLVSYRADPRPGWEFVGWEGTGCAVETILGHCEYDVEEIWMALTNATWPDLEFPPTVAVFRQLDGGAGNDRFVEGEHYDVLPSRVGTVNPENIEIVEFFTYDCGGCYNFLPLVSEWEASLPGGVVHIQSPVASHGWLVLQAKAFYAAEALGVLDPVHEALLYAANVGGNRLVTAEAIGQIFTANGVDNGSFSATLNSSSVASKVSTARLLASDATVISLPSMLVAGRYLVSTSHAGTQFEMLEIVDYLIEKERAAEMP